MKKDTLKKLIVTCFVIVPLLSSIISTVHLVDLFYLGNPSWISYTVAVAIEIGAVASFLTLSILSRLNKTIVWGMFIILFFMQVVGNVYFSYDWVTKRIAEDPNWMKNFRDMMEFFIFEIEEKTAKMVLALLIGVPIPLISVFLLKSTTDYLGDDSNETPAPVTTVSEEPIEVPEVVAETEKEQKADEDQIHITEESSEEEILSEEELARRKRIHAARA
mgnify:CR=1 FL=1